jgi:2'-5' RNA ligase
MCAAPSCSISMRLFVAIEISQAMQRRIGRLIDGLRSTLGRGASGVAWVPEERLHLTVQFIGHVAAPTADAIQQRFEAPYAIAPFVLQAAGLGMFPPSGRPRVIWLGVRRGAEGAAHVHAETVRRLEGIEFRREARPYAAHLTIGRVREGAPRLRRDVADASSADAGRCTIDHVTLFESRLSARGPTYLPLVRTPLVAPT